MSDAFWQSLGDHLARHMNASFVISQRHHCHGGSINQAYRLITEDGRSLFVKMHPSASADMFEAEAAGLQELFRSQSIRVPEVLATGVTDSQSWIAMEWLQLGCGDMQSARLMGEQLAAMHHCTAPQYGWHRHNTIGSTPQLNTRETCWLEFFREHRLRYQLNLAADHGFCGALQRKGERLLADMDAFFADYMPAPSLLHGDLWGGNQGTDSQGRPVLFDPAVYYGDRETDLAMTTLFGGFERSFYEAYQAVWPLDAGYQVRRTLYNLYHILNHANLFGGSYAMQAERMIDSLLAEL